MAVAEAAAPVAAEPADIMVEWAPEAAAGITAA
jgi:hypothetical protein